MLILLRRIGSEPLARAQLIRFGNVIIRDAIAS